MKKLNPNVSCEVYLAFESMIENLRCDIVTVNNRHEPTKEHSMPDSISDMVRALKKDVYVQKRESIDMVTMRTAFSTDQRAKQTLRSIEEVCEQPMLYIERYGDLSINRTKKSNCVSGLFKTDPQGLSETDIELNVVYIAIENEKESFLVKGFL